MPDDEPPFSLALVIEKAREVDTWSKGNDFDRFLKRDKKFDKLLKTLSDEKDWREILELILVFIDVGHRDMQEQVDKIFASKKLINWKARRDMIDAIVARLARLSALRTDELPDVHQGRVELEAFVQMLTRNKLLGEYLGDLYGMLKNGLQQEENTTMYPGAIQVMQVIPYTSCPEWTHELLALSLAYMRAHPDVPENDDQARLALYTLMFMFLDLMGGGGKVKINGLAADVDKDKSTVKDGPLMAVQADVLAIWELCLEQDDWEVGAGDDLTVCGEALKMILEDFLNRNTEKTALLRPFMPGVRRLWECGQPTLERDANYIVEATAGNLELVGGDQAAGDIIDLYLAGQAPNVLHQFTKMYPDCPELFHPRVGEFIAAWRGADSWVVMVTLQLLWEIAKTKPQAFSAGDVAAVVDTLQRKDTYAMGLMTLQALAAARPAAVRPHGDQIVGVMSRQPDMAAMGAGVLTDLAKDDRELSIKYLAVFEDLTSKVQPTYQINLLLQMKNVGIQFRDILEPYREFFEKKMLDPTLHDIAAACLDALEGRTLKTVSDDVADQREDLTELGERVAGTEDNVENLSREVERTQGDVDGVRREVADQGERLGDLEEVVEETVEKVEEIDHKTLSHAPAWSREVARLLNPPSDRDWRLLAQRLGYTNDDVRNWATQPDPCLSLLDEWFATHKTREATYAVSKLLEEVGRLDAAAVVVSALEDTKDTVESDDEDEVVDPPPVFISYQWGHQQEVKLLQKHLNMAGYESWLDIGQMGGGDKLFAKIDQGIRAAKVVIACVTDKYAQSPNCNREVNLCVTLGKPIIPLLLERMPWPPAGTMGPIFSEYLFIRFFARPGEGADDDRYWPLAKFQELLMQMRMNIAPVPELVTDEYSNWWQPPEEVIVIPAKDAGSKHGAAPAAKVAEEGEKPSSSPEVFISYQWDRQPEIKALYARLSQLGLSCWLDITQMGGGDSLYDKIDRGVRGCKVMLSCVTTKYALSANCRREVSLADAVKKPIIPLRLEAGAEWPPAGPMSMVFTQMLYIDFAKGGDKRERPENFWNVDAFDQLIAKIYEVIPPPGESSLPVILDEKKVKAENKPEKNTDKKSNSNVQARVTENEDIKQANTAGPAKTGLNGGSTTDDKLSAKDKKAALQKVNTKAKNGELSHEREMSMPVEKNSDAETVKANSPSDSADTKKNKKKSKFCSIL